MFRGKKYQESAKQIDKATLYDPKEGLELICKTASAKFDETVELHVKLGVDSRHADQQVRGAIVLPNGTGKSVRVLVFAKGDKAEAGASAAAQSWSPPAPTTWARWTWWRRSRRKTGSTSTWSSLPPT